ncbi:aspartyl-phosphate phosphatase Spo0E family protein [Bacillus sp. 31A1R]|uniref:Aspartyl-phosphate phosphatase Spo0E family protein n=1 Tax=Robertmurraya mangrovi TaxID=3098077 RepID=A0ABU5IW49_9BACI|nr:aspartyl-phosphate phosphatase Spo0E family protein [Bacillus sp. 31A1R]MDZ5471367.1 aspartyl-phosphate phosphatase Spo0E family protein [Bacillus sp. 31A1R]
MEVALDITLTDLQQQIQREREGLIQLGLQYGLLHPFTIQKSQELDVLIVLYQKKVLNQ